jgi:hypothetical protein
MVQQNDSWDGEEEQTWSINWEDQIKAQLKISDIKPLKLELIQIAPMSKLINT